MAKTELTKRQRVILEFIETRITRHGQSPTVREIGRKFGIKSTNGVRTHLTALIKKGFLKKQALISRGLELTRELAQDIAHIPVVGSVPAGLPIDAIENVEGEVAVDLSFLPKGQTFTLRVDGDSMRDAGILNGDLLLVRKQETAQSGDIVVAIIDGEATVKRYLPKGRKIILQPENDEFEPIVVDRKSGDFRLAGKVGGLLRRFDR
jgi:repressor LexA